MEMKTYAVPSALLLLIQLSCIGTAASEQISTDTVVVSDSFEKEASETKKQIADSAPKDSVQSVFPPSGRVLNTQQKLDAGHDATTIVNQTPGDRKRIPAKNPDGTPTVALALGGGGARGVAHIGVLRVLEAEHIHIDQIVGNSMGAIVGGLYSAGVPLNDISSH